MIEFDLHIHSKYSFDSLMKPKVILKIAQKKGLDAIAITDHGTIKGGLEADRIKRILRLNVDVVIGAEILTSAGDVIGLFLSEEIRQKEVNEVCDEIHSQGGLVLLPHPFKGHKLSLLQTFLDRVDMVELLNSRTSLTIENMKTIRGFKKRLVGFSDAHFPSEIGLFRTLMDPSSDFSNIRDAKRCLMEAPIVTMKGKLAPPYLESYSQLIKSVKLRYYKQIPTNFFYTIYQMSRKV